MVRVHPNALLASHLRLYTDLGEIAHANWLSNGDVLLADYDNGRLLRLIMTSPTGTYPGSLAETGLFADLATLTPAPGVLPYTVNLPFWSDYAVKSRWFTLPDAAATMIANEVDVDHPAIARRMARDVKDDSDLGDLPVTVAVDVPDKFIVAPASGKLL